MNNVKNENNNDFKTINTIIKDLSISPQKKLYIYLDSKPIIKENDKNNTYKYYLYDIKDMFLAPINGAGINSNNIKDNNNKNTYKINKEYTPQ